MALEVHWSRWFRWVGGRTDNDNDSGDLGIAVRAVWVLRVCVVEDVLINTQQSSGPVQRHFRRDRGQFGVHLEAAVAPST